ncbi:MAG TPA: glycosyltransferase [Puia sp.]|jgi:glycosyltransferase involved in cell wall biosynthesis
MQKICIIIPCYNEERRFDQNSFIKFLDANPSYEFCLVNDGSKDRTADILNELAGRYDRRISVLDLKDNVGKAEAVRKALLFCEEKALYDYIGYIDADFSAPLSEINHMLAFCNGELTHFIIGGSRIKRLGANILRKPSRHYLGRIFATFGGWILKLPVYDSQCGLKLIKAEVVRQLFSEPFITKWLFDLELLFRLRNIVGPETVNSKSLEIPLNEWVEKGGSKITLFNFLRVPYDLLRIHYKYNRS